NLTVDTLTTKESNAMLYSSLSNPLSSKDTTTDSVLYTTTYIYNNIAESQLYLRSLLLAYNDLTSKRYVSYSATTSYHIKINFDSETGMLTIPDQLIEGRTITNGNMATFTVKGEGKIDLKKNMAEILYTTSYDDGTGIVTQSYKLVTPLL
ncbi:MAG: hypothetical protein KDC07_08310, partial [Chitinophagaceae bacterium]|nr:hypothetical protein [Chitinophagaceae bacterium]